MRAFTRRNLQRFSRPREVSGNPFAALLLLAFASAVGLAEAAPARDDPATTAAAQLEDRYPERRVAFPHGVTSLADVTYSAPSGFRPLTLDLYLPPPHAGAAPVIVYVHGGGWLGGHARHCGAFENWPRVLASLAASGYVVASVNYRLSGEAVSPAASNDVAVALRWLRTNAARYSIDKQRVGIWGVSAGGQLAAIAGTTCDAVAGTGTQSACVQAVATWYGIFDFAPLIATANPEAPPLRYLGCVTGVCSEEQISLASAIRHIDRSTPPFLLVHGTRDQTVPAAQSQAFHEALLSHDIRSELLLIDDVDHSFIGAKPEATRAASLRALRATTDFFDRTLRPDRKSAR
jgi:acetyl esterase/lipase